MREREKDVGPRVLGRAERERERENRILPSFTAFPPRATPGYAKRVARRRLLTHTHTQTHALARQYRFRRQPDSTAFTSLHHAYICMQGNGKSKDKDMEQMKYDISSDMCSERRVQEARERHASLNPGTDRQGLRSRYQETEGEGERTPWQGPGWEE